MGGLFGVSCEQKTYEKTRIGRNQQRNGGPFQAAGFFFDRQERRGAGLTLDGRNSAAAGKVWFDSLSQPPYMSCEVDR